MNVTTDRGKILQSRMRNNKLYDILKLAGGKIHLLRMSVRPFIRNFAVGRKL